MKISFYGAARNVTGSQIVIEVNNTKIGLDCGLFQGRRDESYQKNMNFKHDPAQLSTLLLSHSHIDHSGNIPNLVKKGFKGTIYSTHATVELSKILLKDSAYLQQKDVEWVNKIKLRKDEPLVHPLYTIEDAAAAMDHFVGIDYDKTFSVAPGVSARFRDAGHILGSASITLEIEEKGKKYTLGYSGDVGRPNMPIMHDPNQMRDLDILLMETTYGNRFHDPFGDVEDRLVQLIVETSRNGGKIIIPSFAVGRTQLIVYILHKLYNENRIPEIPIFVDSPMAVAATEVFRSHYAELDRETQRVFLQNHEDPFGFSRLKYIESIEDSKKLNTTAFPCIIISASGMCEGGRILHHLRNNIENHKNVILFVGYAAQHTLARKILDGNEVVKIYGEEFKVKAQVQVIDAFSAHADRKELLQFMSLNTPERLKNIFLVHGEYDQQEPFKNALRSKGYRHVHIPEEGETVEL